MNREEYIDLFHRAEVNLVAFKQINDCGEELRKMVEMAVKAEREACLDVVETHRIPVGNSSAGEMACEWTYEALKEISATIRARGQKPAPYESSIGYMFGDKR